MSNPYKFSNVNRKRQQEAEERRTKFLAFASSRTKQSQISICEAFGISTDTLREWRHKFPEFNHAFLNMRRSKDLRVKTPQRTDALGRSFVENRLHYFGYETPWFQLATVQAYAKAKPGDIVFVLMPPEHGKTTLTEDDLTLSIGQNPNTMITLVSEGERMAQKMSSRIQRRMMADGPFPDFVYDFGPFQPQEGESQMQPWGVKAWTVYQANMSADQRDFTMAIGGWRSAIAGTRALRLHLDDIQSLRSLGQTEDMWTTFRQDMLSRPGETGITTGNGTRVGPRDFYARVDDEFRGEDFYKKVEFPAIVLDNTTQEPKPLWEYDERTRTGYTMESLERLRKKVGEEAWWRNYMQAPKSNELEVFSEDGINLCLNPMRTYGMSRYDLPDSEITHGDAWITVDPSIGGRNIISAMHPEADKLWLLAMREDSTLPRNSAIANAIDQVASDLKAKGWRTTMLVIEAMAFQKGLMEDEAIKDVAARHGMRLESHMTGLNKYDEEVGVPSMASSVESGLIDLPYSTDHDRYLTDLLLSEFRAWKPYRDKHTNRLKFKRGTQLRQDMLMALWFGWIWWINLYAGSSIDGRDMSEGINFGGVPYGMTNTGLLTPNRG